MVLKRLSLAGLRHSNSSLRVPLGYANWPQIWERPRLAGSRHQHCVGAGSGATLRFRPKADVCRSAHPACYWVQLYVGLLAGPGRLKIELY